LASPQLAFPAYVYNTVNYESKFVCKIDLRRGKQNRNEFKEYLPPRQNKPGVNVIKLFTTVIY
jgi:hypothetical protein